MFMNARPRMVSNGFEALLPTWKAEQVHQSLVKMAHNNKVQAGGNFWPVATVMSDGWNCSHDDLHDDDNSSLHVQNSASLQHSTTSYSQTPGLKYEKAPGYSTILNDHHQAQREFFAVQQAYEDPSPNLNGYAQQNQRDSWACKHRDGIFAEFTNCQNTTKFLDYQRPSSTSDLNPQIYALTVAPTPSLYHESPSGNSSFLRPKSHDSSAVQTNFTSISVTSNPSPFTYADIPRGNPSTKDLWYPETFNTSHLQCQDYCGLLFHNNMPQGQILEEHCQTHQSFGAMWDTNHAEDRTWPSQPHSASPETVSPEALTLIVPPPVPSSSSGSPNNLQLSLSDLSTGTSSDDDDLSIHDGLKIAQPVPVRPRHVLPDSIPTSRRSVPVVASVNLAITEASSRNRSLRGKSDTSQLLQATPLHHGTFPSASSSQTKLKSKRIQPVGQATEQSSSKAPQPTKESRQRDAKDIFLIQSKLAGMSYKDIRKQGGFTEAESTLRGRFRTLTKAKSARVRKPEWTNNDIRLLERAVRVLTTPSEYAQSRVPWKQVADFIASNGGSYHFGNATCRKKWDELNEDDGE